MNVFLCRLKTEGKDGRNRIEEALERNEIWIGWGNVCDLVGKGFTYEKVVQEAKDRFAPTSSAPKQIGLFTAKMREQDLVITCPDGGQEFFVGQITEDNARPMSVPWLRGSKLPGRIVKWLNYKRARPIAFAPQTVRSDIHKNCTCLQFDNEESLLRWVREMIRDEAEPQTVEKRLASEAEAVRDGQGFQADPRVRKAVEEWAMMRAESRLKRDGYHDIENKSKHEPYDFECRKGRKIFYVEVKGAQGRGETIILTAGEKEHMGKHASQSFLLRVSHIELKKPRLKAKGGVVQLFAAEHLLSGDRWRPTQWELTLP